MWKNGSTAIARSAANSSSVLSVASGCVHCAMFATRFRCVSITPFWIPVVPLEYGSAIRSSAGLISTCGGSPSARSSEANGVAPSASPYTKISSTPERSAATVAFSSSSGTVTSSRAPESTSCLASSSSVSSGFAVVFTPPADATPWKAIAYSGRFGAQWANTSPLPKPRAASPAANRRTSSTSWP